ncbi:MAG: DEAD/DEAH box helicase [Leptolyngbya sp. RL_3_1]|nr:DEAD/DEAH box helicase [Leptolyngbya sp. RL_3_1]
MIQHSLLSKTQPNTPQIQLRIYQRYLVSQIHQVWRQNLKILTQLPTGAGKTIIFSAIASEFVQRGEQVLILAHRQELIEQAAGKASAIAGCDVGIIKSGHKPNYSAPVQVASVQSLVNRLSRLECPGLVIVDECHHSTAATYRRILKAYPDAYVLGVTATPARADGTGFDDIYDALVTGPTVSELIQQGHLSEFRLFGDPNPMTTGRSRGGDYAIGDMERQNDAIELSGSLIGSYRQHCPGKRCLAFAVSVAHSKAIAQCYRVAGIPAEHLDGDTPSDERKAALARFESGETLVLSNCGLFTEGYDLPTLDAVQVARPTKSLSLWLQMVGRALRPAPGKDYALILDHTRNWAIHGLPTRPRVWTLEGVEQSQRVINRTPEGLVIESEPEPPEEFKDGAGVLEQVAPDPLEEWRQAYQGLLATALQRRYSHGWIYHKLLELRPPLEIWQMYASERGFKPGWAWYRYQETQEQKAS